MSNPNDEAERIVINKIAGDVNLLTKIHCLEIPEVALALKKAYRAGVASKEAEIEKLTGILRGADLFNEILTKDVSEITALREENLALKNAEADNSAALEGKCVHGTYNDTYVENIKLENERLKESLSAVTVIQQRDAAIKQLKEVNDGLKRRIDLGIDEQKMRFAAKISELETQLAAISTVTLCNTSETLATQLMGSDNPYWTVAYGDVVETVKREIALREEVDNLSTKLKRTEDAAYHALLEMSAWLGIPERKREQQIEDCMSNVRFCAKHDMRENDRFYLKRDLDILREENERLKQELKNALK